MLEKKTGCTTSEKIRGEKRVRSFASYELLRCTVHGIWNTSPTPHRALHLKPGIVQSGVGSVVKPSIDLYLVPLPQLRRDPSLVEATCLLLASDRSSNAAIGVQLE